MKKIFLKFSIYFVFFFVAFSSLSCIRLHNTSSEEVNFYKNGDLCIPRVSDVPDTLFIEMQDSTKQNRIILKYLKEALLRRNFSIVESPSKAGYILHLSLLRTGKVDKEKLREIVNAGYGSEHIFIGNEVTACLADILLVQRRVPSSKKETRANLENISARNAIESAQIRIGVFHKKGRAESYADNAFSRTLANVIASSIIQSNNARSD